MSDYLDNIYESTENINNQVYELRLLSRAFYATGNVIMGEDLNELARSLSLSSKKIDDAVSEELSRSLVVSQQQSANMLNACLAVGSMTRTENG